MSHKERPAPDQRPLQRQTTLKNAIHCSGTALHHGGHVSMAMIPAPANTGIVFRRTDLAGRGVSIPADWRHVADMPMCTAIEADGVQIATIEHVRAALAGGGIDNLLIEVQGPELPIIDGSAWGFVFMIECAGVVELETPRRFVKILRPVTLTAGGRSVSLRPGEGFSIDFEVDYGAGAIAPQRCEIEIVDGAFKNELSRARTFGFLHEVDALGDLYLAGAPIMGRFEGRRSGHKLNHRLLRALFQRRDAWCWSDSNAAASPSPEPKRVAGLSG